MEAQSPLLHLLHESVRALALDADRQEALFPAFVVVADELALNFDDAFRLVDQLLAAGRISPDQHAALVPIDALLAAMTARGEPALWTPRALREREEWRAVRAAARHAMEVLGIPAAGEVEAPRVWYVEAGREPEDAD